MRLVVLTALCSIIACVAMPAAAATYTIELLPTDADGRTDAVWTRYGNGSTTVNIADGLLHIGTYVFSGPATTPISRRSIAEFNLAIIPDVEVVTSATLSLGLHFVTSQGLFALGWIEQLDASVATGHPDTDYSYASLALGRVLAPIMPADIFPRASFDVTSAIRMDHAAGRSYSALSVVEDPDRFTSIGWAEFYSEDRGPFGGQRPTLFVTTSPVPAPAAVWLMIAGLVTVIARRRRRAAVPAGPRASWTATGAHQARIPAFKAAWPQGVSTNCRFRESQAC